MNKIPQLRLLVTSQCIFDCKWCQAGGEGGAIEYEKPSFEMSLEEIVKCVALLAEAGISHIKISGGEPLIRKDIIDIIREVKKIKGIENVELVTRSPRLKEMAYGLWDSGLNGLTVSFDTLDEEKFMQYTGYRQSNGLNDLIEGIKLIRKMGMPVKLNVIPQYEFNDKEIISLAEFSGENGTSLKFIDLMTMNKSWWKERFISLNMVEKILEPIIETIDEAEFQAGGLGTPMKSFILKNGVKVYFRDASSGTHYGEICSTCLNYPCQDGLMAVRLTCDGKLKYCLYRDDNTVDLLSLYNQKLDIEEKIHDVIDIFRNSEFRKAWSVENELNKVEGRLE